MKVRNLLLFTASAASLLAGTSASEAASTYVSLFGGASLLQKPGLKGISHTHSTTYTFVSHQSVDTSFKTGFVVGGNWGIDWGTFRTELEAAYHGNTSKSSARVRTLYQYAGHTHTGGGATGPGWNPLTTLSQSTGNQPANIKLNAYSLMANVWYDFHDFGQSFGVTPYVGGGIGLAQIQIGGKLGGNNLIEKNDYVFAWQLGAGASVPLSDDISFFADYRYFAADGAKLRIAPGLHGGDVDADFDSHEVLLGFRLTL
ncbi:MAG: outer membrane beta-barrel protein [Rhizomicrobium sp.]